MFLAVYVSVVVGGAVREEAQCPPLKAPPGARVDVAPGGRMALIKCGSKPQVTLCLSGKWRPQSSCRNAQGQSHAAAGAAAGREKRSPNTGKYEALRRRMKVQRRIQKGLLVTRIGRGTPSRLRLHAGDDALLMCRVHNLGVHAVTWTRRRDNIVLAIDDTVLVRDPRLSPIFEEQTETWILKISGVQAYDGGGYECQVSTRPPLRKELRLEVVPPDQPLEASSLTGKLWLVSTH